MWEDCSTYISFEKNGIWWHYHCELKTIFAIWSKFIYFSIDDNGYKRERTSHTLAFP